MTLDFPCKLNLTIKPVIPGFTRVPFATEIPFGEVKVIIYFIKIRKPNIFYIFKKRFRFSVPMNFVSGRFNVYWITLRDTIPATYTPLRKTVVIIGQKTG